MDCGERGCLIGYLKRRQLAGTSEMVFILEVPNWLSAGCIQLVDMPCLIHKCLHLILTLVSISGSKHTDWRSQKGAGNIVQC